MKTLVAGLPQARAALLAVCGLLVGLKAAGEDIAGLPKNVEAFTDQYCSDCHDSEEKKGGLDLTSLMYHPSDTANFALWVKVVERVQKGEMPPKKRERPDAVEMSYFIGSLTSTLVESEKSSVARTGRATRRRLNRSEYENSLRDLLNAPWILVKDQLPEDGEAFRFNKVAEALDVSHVHLARYINAADYALRQAMAVKFVQPPTVLRRYYARESMTYGQIDGNPDRGRFPIFNSQADPEVLLRKAPMTVGESDPVKREQEAMAWTASNYVSGFTSVWNLGFHAPVAGRYRMRFSGYTVWVGPNGIRTPTLSFVGKTNKDGSDADQIAVVPPDWYRPNYFDVSNGRTEEPIEIYARGGASNRQLGGFDLSPDPSIRDVGDWWLEANESIVTDATRFFRSRPGMTTIDSYTNPLARPDGIPGVAFRWMEVEGPLYDEKSTAGYELLFGDLPMKRVDAGVPGVAIDAVQMARPSPPDRRRGGGRKHDVVSQVIPTDATPQFRAAVAARSAGLGNGSRPGGTFANAPTLSPVTVEVVSAHPMQDAERLLRGFLARIYRRPAQPEDAALFLDLIKSRLDAGVGFASAMLTGYTAVLASPEFLFLDEKPGRLDQTALATRLALFLWNSLPDATLLARAERGELEQADSLRSEVDRMLADPRSERFIHSFLDYWLELRRIEDTTPSTTLYNDYYLDDSLVEASIAETRMFFTELVKRDLPARNIIDSDFTYVNGRLAAHYGLSGIKGYAMRRIDLPRGSVRGGFMTQASILKVTANGTTTSPVLRGKWISERIMGFEIPPPPAGVPAVEPDIRGAVTIRQQLDKHRADASCAACHRTIDPPGFALESFDVMGGWRDKYRAESKLVAPEPGIGKNGWPFTFHYAQPVDATGELTDGRSFQDVRGLKKLLLADEPQIARNLTNHLSVYATGARVRFSDRAKIEQIVATCASNHYGVRSLIYALVQSDLFRSK